jgi:DNA topoisomerase I
MRVGRLHRIDPSRPGISRRRQGRGFLYVDAAGNRIEDPRTLERIRSLAVPPAWTDVWIAPDPDGHIQATGTDAAGRKQYRYHDLWRQNRDRAKHRRIEEFGRELPKLRRRVSRDLADTGLTERRVLAGAVRMLDTVALRIGGEEYAKRNGSYGLSTLQPEHLRLVDHRAELRFTGKSGKELEVEIRDRKLLALLNDVARAEGRTLLVWRNGHGLRGIHPQEVNGYIRASLGNGFSAKDFRTWNATVLAAALLSKEERSTGRKAVSAVVKEVAAHLGNTPAVCRSSYIDPRVLDRFLDEGEVITPAGPGRRQIEEATLALLAGD